MLNLWSLEDEDDDFCCSLSTGAHHKPSLTEKIFRIHHPVNESRMFHAIQLVIAVSNVAIPMLADVTRYAIRRRMRQIYDHRNLYDSCARDYMELAVS